MALIKNAELYFAKLDPKRPSAKYNKENPTWELQIRTQDPEQKKQWEGLDLKPKLIVYSERDTEHAGEPILVNGKKQWRVNLRKRSLDKDKEPTNPVEVVDGNMEKVDPNTIGNGSIGNLRIYQYVYGDENKVATVLMKVQLVKHIVYVRKPSDDDFEMLETETILPEEGDVIPSTETSPNPPKDDDMF